MSPNHLVFKGNQRRGLKMRFEDARVRRLWSQQFIPVVVRQGSSEPILVRLPYADDNRTWLRGDHRNQPTWNSDAKYWSVPKSWFDDVVHRALIRYGKAYVIQLYKRQQTCAPACWNAKGFHCECSCLGAHHGNGHPSGAWFMVSDTFAFNWGDTEYACRLITAINESLHV